MVPGVVGRAEIYNNMEFERSVETLNLVADIFTHYNIKEAIEPIRSTEVSFVHTVKEAKEYINAVGHLENSI
jgi:D-psicose/D-tagatose/L-ribulose 3-epimerase